MNKYGNQPTVIKGIRFDSKHEAMRYIELDYYQRIGAIHDLQLQVPFELIPARRNEKGKVIEKAVKYVADFVYTTSEGDTVVEDAKGCKTEVYKLKKKMMLYFKGIEVKEV